jgi:hypothetical protein
MVASSVRLLPLLSLEVMITLSPALAPLMVNGNNEFFRNRKATFNDLCAVRIPSRDHESVNAHEICDGFESFRD